MFIQPPLGDDTSVLGITVSMFSNHYKCIKSQTVTYNS